MEIKSKLPNDLYRSNYDRIFNGNVEYVPEVPSGWKEESPEALHESPSEEKE